MVIEELKEYKLPDVWRIPRVVARGSRISVFEKINEILHTVKPETVLDLINSGRTKVDATSFARDYRESIGFQEYNQDLVVLCDPIGLTRVLPGGKVETYPEKMQESRRGGLFESASYGKGEIVGNTLASFISNWGFMGASAGAVYGDKLTRLMELATKADLPVFMLYSSGGQRQQEAAGALIEMDHSGHYIRKFKRLRHKPITSILVGDVWGGVPASVVTEGDFVIGMTGTNFGFAGPGVIEGFTGERPPEGVQTVEYSALTNRKVHVVLKDLKELGEAQGAITSFAYRETGQANYLPVPRKEARGLNFDTLGFHTPLQSTVDRNKGSRAETPLAFGQIKPDSVYNQHRILRYDSRRPDTEYLIQNAFDGYVPLYTNWTNVRKDGTYLRSPAIIAALAYIDDPRLSKRLWTMVIGNQPSYLKQDNGGVMKEPASPTAWDYRYQIDMMKTAERLRIPVISFTDTLGARPTLDAEANAQYKAISDCLALKDTLRVLQLGFITGVVGSGGGLATTLGRDHLGILDDAQMFVAEPESATRIIVKNPTHEDIVRTTEQMRPTAAFLKEIGIVDSVINTEGGAQNDPFGVALKIREAIIADYLELGGLSPVGLLRRAEHRLNNLRPIPIGHLMLPAEKNNPLGRFLKWVGIKK